MAASTALITGFAAKENVSKYVERYCLVDPLRHLLTMFTPLTAFTFLVFALLYTPCVAAIAAVRNELGGKRAIGVAIQQCVVAWVVAFIVHAIGLALGLG